MREGSAVASNATFHRRDVRAAAMPCGESSTVGASRYGGASDARAMRLRCIPCSTDSSCRNPCGRPGPRTAWSEAKNPPSRRVLGVFRTGWDCLKPFFGTGDRTRTYTTSLPVDFESTASTIPPHRHGASLLVFPCGDEVRRGETQCRKGFLHRIQSMFAPASDAMAHERCVPDIQATLSIASALPQRTYHSPSWG